MNRLSAITMVRGTSNISCTILRQEHYIMMWLYQLATHIHTRYYLSLTASYFSKRCIIYIILYIWRSIPWYELAGNHKTSELPSFMKFVDQSHFQLALLHRNHQHEDFTMSRVFYIMYICWQYPNCNYVWSRQDVSYKISNYCIQAFTCRKMEYS